MVFLRYDDKGSVVRPVCYYLLADKLSRLKTQLHYNFVMF